MAELYIGMMSGTSADGIDAVIAEFSTSNQACKIVETHSFPFDPGVKQQIESLFEPNRNEVDRLGALDKQLGELYANCANSLLIKAGLRSDRIKAIGNHGQTIRHRPNINHPFTLQIGDAATIASQTAIPTIYDFRKNDIAAGGQGAPLTPAFHSAVFSSPTQNRCIVNIGGIANITTLPINGPIRGWDTGPGNGLMDAWIAHYKHLPFDNKGEWAGTGQVNRDLLKTLLLHPYFKKLPPKSTGKEEFNFDWLKRYTTGVSPEDVQRTLLELTARTVSVALQEERPDAAYFCGGGAFNALLMNRISELCPSVTIDSTLVLGIAPCWVEAAAFAWLAHQYCHQLPGNLPSVTGASRPTILGSMTHP